MSGLVEALELRNQAFFFTRDRERMQRFGNKLSLTASDEFLDIAFHDFCYSGTEEWVCDIWFTPSGFSPSGMGRRFQCLSISWNAYNEYNIMEFERGTWEAQCLALNSDTYPSPEGSTHNEYVSDSVREILSQANRDPAACLRKQNGMFAHLTVAAPCLIGIGRRLVNLEDDSPIDEKMNQVPSKYNMKV